MNMVNPISNNQVNSQTKSMNRLMSAMDTHTTSGVGLSSHDNYNLKPRNSVPGGLNSFHSLEKFTNESRASINLRRKSEER